MSKVIVFRCGAGGSACLIASVLMLAAQKGTPASDPIIENARKAGATFIESLPKYLTKRTTTRLESARPTCSTAQLMSDPDGCRDQAMQSWRTTDVVTADVVTDNGKEVDLNIKLNGSPATAQDVDQSGSWSQGDYAGTLQAILAPASAAKFTKQHQVTIVKRPAYRYEYSIDHPHSSWHLYAGSSSYSPAYGGEIWIDRDTSRVLRVTLSAHDVPDSFPMYRVEWSLDYDFVKIGAATPLVPTHAETLGCQRDTSICSKNSTDFQDYKEYTSDTSVSFGDPGK